MEKETAKRLGRALNTIESISANTVNGVKGMRNDPPTPGSTEKGA